MTQLHLSRISSTQKSTVPLTTLYPFLSFKLEEKTDLQNLSDLITEVGSATNCTQDFTGNQLILS